MSDDFTDPIFIQPDLRPVQTVGRGIFKKQIYMLMEDWEYLWEAEGKRYRMFFKRGIVTDIASVPRILWVLIPPDGDQRAAALPHDELYQYQGRLPKGRIFSWRDEKWEDISDCHWSRKDSDKFLANILDAAGSSKLKRRAMYLGVRIGGWHPWMKQYPPLLSPERISYLLRQYDKGRLRNVPEVVAAEKIEALKQDPIL